MEWISHRGESIDAPENTLPAFDLARKRNTDGSECDVYLTIDGKLVVCHDGTTARMGDVTLTIEENDSKALRKVNVAGHFGKGFGKAQIPFLHEALSAVGSGRKFYIELKTGRRELAEAVQKELSASALALEQIVIISFFREVCAYSKQIMPQYRTLWLTGLKTETGIMSATELIAILREIGADGVDAQYAAVTPEFVAELKQAGFYFAVWTVDSAEEAERMIRCNVDAITSNRAAELMNRYRSRSKN